MNDESREDFELWILKERPMLFAIQRPDGSYRDIKTQSLWCAWQASRTALVVDIANHTEFEIEHIISPEKEGYSIGWIDGRNYSVKQVCAAGITVKGEGGLISTPDHALDKKWHDHFGKGEGDGKTNVPPQE